MLELRTRVLGEDFFQRLEHGAVKPVPDAFGKYVDIEPVGYVLLFRSAVFYTLLLRGIRSAAVEIPSGDDPKPADAGSEK